ncbi:hypothetical protein ABJI51_03135 [Amycolatopsis sp. NEAU-NG30]|uniref:Uncharacterized protein n=1 Tax=Amycolatopsis melonis TaxID=3156488 RepID=A0ABV0L9F4_9PSEU
MNSVESFANTGAALQPLEMVTQAAPVSCFWAAFNGAGAAFIANWAVEKAVDYYKAHHQGGHQDGGEVPSFAGDASGLSGDALLALRAL